MNLSSFKGSQNHIENLLSASRHSKEGGREGTCVCSAAGLRLRFGPPSNPFIAVEGDVKGVAFQRVWSGASQPAASCILVQLGATSWP